MNLLRNTYVAAEFELRRSLAMRRILNLIVLAGFPPAMFLILVLGPGVPQLEFVIGATVLMVCQLSLLLWAAPIVSSELEGKTWGYHAVRAGGKNSTILGKYLAAVVWAVAVGWGALLSCLLISSVAQPSGNEVSILFVFGLLTVIGSFTYGAIFTLIGAVMHRRAMVAAVFYMVGVEVILAWLPAVVNQFTVSFHLFGLAVHWLDWEFFDKESVTGQMFVEQPVWRHLGILGLLCGVALLAAVYWVKTREFITADES